jgi:hypothetical protein
LSLADDPTQSCASVDRIARIHLRKVETQIGRLEALRAELSDIIDQCEGGEIDTCRIVDALASPMDYHPDQSLKGP